MPDGPERDALVDPQPRVQRVSRLRVVNAAVMPSVPAGNTKGPTIMIVEKASDMILKDARVPA